MHGLEPGIMPAVFFSTHDSLAQGGGLALVTAIVKLLHFTKM